MLLARSRLGCEWRAFVELWWWPLIVALLPYRSGLAVARFVSRRLPLYDEAARMGLAAYRSVAACADERTWLADFRFSKLIDHADLFWAVTRSESFLLKQLAPSSQALPAQSLLVISFHYGQGLWLMRWLRAQGVRPRFLSVPSVRAGADSTLMFLYGRLRIRVVERLAGVAPIFLGGARRSIRDALAAGETVYGLVDVPVKRVAGETANAKLFGHAVRLPTGLLDSARGAHVKVAVLTSRLAATGRRAIDLEIFEDADALSINTLVASLERRIDEDAPAWHFWNLWNAFRA